MASSSDTRSTQKKQLRKKQANSHSSLPQRTSEDITLAALDGPPLINRSASLSVRPETACQPTTGTLSFIPAILKERKREKKREELLASLTNDSTEDVIDYPSCGGGQTELHLAVAQGNFNSAVLLVAFGADVNAIDNEGRTPLDLLKTNSKKFEDSICLSSSDTLENSLLQQSPGLNMLFEERKKMEELLIFTGAMSREEMGKFKVEEVAPFPPVPSLKIDPTQSEGKQLTWECKLASLLPPSSSLCDEAGFLKRAGSRVLCLDGGGIRGLVQIEALSQLERKTGRKITELFDWIVGTSTGGIIALALVYGKKTLPQLRQLYFKLKDEIFGKAKAGIVFNAKKLEEILRKEFKTKDGKEMNMDDVTYPRVMIAAVHKSSGLKFFNNCFNDYYHKCRGEQWPVWKVARYTSAAPLMFGECDGYVDGGLRANNPSESGLTRIEQFYRDSKYLRPPISLVVSIGSGLIPEEELGNTNVQEILFLSFGVKSWIDSTTHVKERAKNLKKLFLEAVTDTETATESCRSRCYEQDIPFFRINPSLKKAIKSQENESDVLIDMMLKARIAINYLDEVKDLIRCFRALSDASNKVHAQLHVQNN